MSWKGIIGGGEVAINNNQQSATEPDEDIYKHAYETHETRLQQMILTEYSNANEKACLFKKDCVGKIKLMFSSCSSFHAYIRNFS